MNREAALKWLKENPSPEPDWSPKLSLFIFMNAWLSLWIKSLDIWC